MDGYGLESLAASALRTYESRLLRAQRDHDEARKAFEQTVIGLQKAEAVYEAAKHVYQAGNADRSRDLGLDKLGPLTLAWVKKLCAYPHAGSAELKDAADAVGWNANPAAIRQQAKRLTEKGVLTRVDEGVYQVSERVHKSLKDQLKDDDIINDDDQEGIDSVDLTLEQPACDTPPFSEGTTTAPITDDCESQVANEPQERFRSVDEYDDDDLPF